MQTILDVVKISFILELCHVNKLFTSSSMSISTWIHAATPSTKYIISLLLFNFIVIFFLDLHNLSFRDFSCLNVDVASCFSVHTYKRHSTTNFPHAHKCYNTGNDIRTYVRVHIYVHVTLNSTMHATWQIHARVHHAVLCWVPIRCYNLR